MSTLAQRVPWLACCPCRSQARETRPQTDSLELAQRYAQGDQHERLCLWLQFREARAQLDRIEAETPPRAAALRRRLHRMLGIPFVG